MTAIPAQPGVTPHPAEVATASYRAMARIRHFETRLLDLFREGLLFGTTHSCIGQEAVAIAAAGGLRSGDYVLSNHRGHGHFLAAGGDARRLFLELMGSPRGVAAGRGGSQHLIWDAGEGVRFFSNGITGGMSPVAAGIAFALKFQGGDGVCVVFIGDGALGQGVFYEAANMASLYGLPVLFAVEDNKYAMSTPVAQGLAGSFRGRAEAFGLAYHDFATDDVVELRTRVDQVVAMMRVDRCPTMIRFDTYRFEGHSKSDTRPYRTREEEEGWQARDPLAILGARLGEELAAEVYAEARAEIEEAYRAAREETESLNET